MKKNIWDKNIPVEKSSYLNNDSLIYYNLDSVNFNKKSLNMLDLFCGAGGFSVGANWAGFQIVFGIDYLEPAMETWVYNHSNSIGCLGDIKKLNPKELKKILKSKGIDKIHLLTGGVPYQGFSRANRKNNLVMVWGKVYIDDNHRTIILTRNSASRIKDFCDEVKGCHKHNLLLKKYNELDNFQKPRYFMQVRYGSTYSKVKHIRVYSYFLDAILFYDGSLWRDA